MEKAFFVYMLASGRNGTLYIGVTSDLAKRAWQHKESVADGSTRKYSVKSLVWFEPHATAESAILREKQLEKWNRAWNVDLIEKANPYWNHLYEEIIG